MTTVAIAMFIATQLTMSSASASLSKCQEDLDTDLCEENADGELVCDYGGDTGRTLAEAQAIVKPMIIVKTTKKKTMN